MLGGTQLFEILVLCDLGLGPLTSFIIYSSKKSRRALLFDYTVVGIVQFAAFVYGLLRRGEHPSRVHSVRRGPDRGRVGRRDRRCRPRARLRIGYRKRPKWGPQLVGIKEPEDPKERDKVLFSALAGKDYPVLPTYYVPYEQKPRADQAAIACR